MLTENEINYLLENKVIIRSKQKTPPKPKELNGISKENKGKYYFVYEGVTYFGCEILNIYIDERIWEHLEIIANIKLYLLKEKIKTKQYLDLINPGNSRLKSLQGEYDRYLLEFDRKYSEYEYAILNEDTIFDIIKSNFYLSNLDKIIILNGKPLDIDISFYDEENKEPGGIIYFIELFKYAYIFHWLLEEIETENKGVIKNNTENLTNLSIETENMKDEKNELIKLGYTLPGEKVILTVPQTAILFEYLVTNNIIHTSHLGNSKTAKILSILTNHSNNTLRVNLSKTKIDMSKKQSEDGKQDNFGNLQKIKNLLQIIISNIDKEIQL